MSEHGVTVPISMLLPLAGAIVAGLGWLFNLQSKIRLLEVDFTQHKTAVTSRLDGLAATDGQTAERLNAKARRLDLCEHTHREFAAQYRRDQLRVQQDLALAGRIERLQRLQERGRVIALDDSAES